MEGSVKLARKWDCGPRGGGRDARINTASCYAASSVLSGVTEVLAVQGFNAVKKDLLESGKLHRDHPDLVELAERVYWQHKCTTACPAWAGSWMPCSARLPGALAHTPR